MNKKVIGIMIGIILILAIVLIVKVSSTEQKKNTEENTIKTQEEIKQVSVEDVVTILGNNGITLKNPQLITSEDLDETGYIYEVENANVEIYYINNTTKVDNITRIGKDGNLKVVSQKTSKEIDCIQYNSNIIIIVTKSNTIKDKIKSILKEDVKIIEEDE